MEWSLNRSAFQIWHFLKCHKSKKNFAYQSCGKERLKTENTALYAQIQATGEPNTKNRNETTTKEAKQN